MKAIAEAGHDEACDRVAAHFQERWLRIYVRSKLKTDGVFAAAYELLRDATEPLLDVGCGVGLLPFYLRERGLTLTITGLDIDERKLRRARAIAAAHYSEIEFLEQNAGAALPPTHGNVAFLDVLHYLAPAAQATLLAQAARQVAHGSLLLLRDCPRDRSARFWVTRVAERFAQAVSWNIGVPLHFATRESICAPFPATEFTLEERPMWGQGPFNNRLFVFRRHS